MFSRMTRTDCSICVVAAEGHALQLALAMHDQVVVLGWVEFERRRPLPFVCPLPLVFIAEVLHHIYQVVGQ